MLLIPDPLWVSELQQAYDLQWIWDQLGLCGVYSKENNNYTLTDPWSDGSAKLELAIYYGEPNRISRLKISGGVTSDLGSVYYCWELQTTTAGRD